MLLWNFLNFSLSYSTNSIAEFIKNNCLNLLAKNCAESIDYLFSYWSDGKKLWNHYQQQSKILNALKSVENVGILPPTKEKFVKTKPNTAADLVLHAMIWRNFCEKCGNYGIFLSPHHVFAKNFVKSTFLLNDLLKIWFYEILF